MQTAASYDKFRGKIEPKTLADCVTLSNGVKMQIVGFGTYKVTGGETVERVLTDAVKVGYRLIDTAKFYHNEKEVGDFLQKLFNGKIEGIQLKREDVFVTTKLWPSEAGYDRATSSFNKQLKELQLDYVDLFLTHWPGTDYVPEGKQPENSKKVRRDTWRAFEEIYKNGKARAIGVSNYTVKHMKELLEQRDDATNSDFIPPMVNQVELHPMLTQVDIRNYCDSKGVLVQGYSTLGKAQLLTDKNLIAMAEKNKKTVPQILLRWSIQNYVPIIPKSENKERMRANSELFNFELSAEDMATLDNMNKNWHCTWDPTNVA